MSDLEIRNYLEGKSTAEIMDAEQSSGVGPTEDGIVMPVGGWEGTIASGDYNMVPVILGSNLHESTLWNYQAPIPTSSGYFWSDLDDTWTGDLSLDEIMPLEGDKNLYQYAAAMGGLNWRLSRVDDVARWLKVQQDDVYGYFFKWDGVDIYPLSALYKFIFGATHASEIAFFFGSLVDVWTDGAAFNPFQDTPGRQALALAMMDYAGNFSWTKNPNGGELPGWEEWSSEEGGPKLISLDATIEEIDTYMITEELTVDSVDAQFWAYYFGLPEWNRDLLFFFK
jgi:para-nitrobenzyl esterase